MPLWQGSHCSDAAFSLYFIEWLTILICPIMDNVQFDHLIKMFFWQAFLHKMFQVHLVLSLPSPEIRSPGFLSGKWCLKTKTCTDVLIAIGVLFLNPLSGQLLIYAHIGTYTSVNIFTLNNIHTDTQFNANNTRCILVLSPVVINPFSDNEKSAFRYTYYT